MKLKKLIYLSFALFVTFNFYNCSSENEKNTATVKFKLVDAPGDYQQVNVEIVDIQYNASTDEEEGWTSFESFSGPVNVDLTTLIAGNDLLLAEEVIEAESLSQIRLILGANNTLLIEGESQTRPLSTPSAQQSGLKLNLNQPLQAGFTYSYVLDWDVQKSIVMAGSSGNFNLKPVIRVIAEATSATVTGKVLADTDKDDSTPIAAVEDALVSLFDSNDELVVETLTNAEGEFSIQGVPSGSYTLKVTGSGYVDFELATSVDVDPGQVFDTGDITIIVE